MWRNVSTPESSTIERWAYNLDTGTLRVAFKSNALYEYKNVPGDVVSGLFLATSCGSYFSKHIRNSYEYTQMKGGCIDQEEIPA